MSSPNPLLPLAFEPLFMERVWGGRRLESLYRKRLPHGVMIGESWEIVDREEAQSVVRDGPHMGRTLHELWETSRAEIFGDVPDAPRFPLLMKILDAREKLSVQVHPPAEVAEALAGEPKTEFWYVAHATADAELYVGLTSGVSRADFEKAIARGEVDQQLHRVAVQKGDSMFLPSGRVHAIGGGNVIVEIQQNSDTTFRVFDWNRTEDGVTRALHVEESLRCIDFADKEPPLISTGEGALLQHELFQVEKWDLTAPRSAEPAGRFAVVCCVSGGLVCAGVEAVAGDFLLLPATLEDDLLSATDAHTTVLRITIPR